MVTFTGTRLPFSNAATTPSGTTMPTLLPPAAFKVVRNVCTVSAMRRVLPVRASRVREIGLAQPPSGGVRRRDGHPYSGSGAADFRPAQRVHRRLAGLDDGRL